MGETCSTHRENGYIILIGKPEGKRRIWILRRRCGDNIKEGLKKIGCKDFELDSTGSE
jgi:hypothetical protein